MAFVPFLTLVTLFAAIWYISSRSKVILRDGKPIRHAPNSLPIVGNGILFLQNRHKLFDWFVKCERIFGFETFAITVPSLPPGVVTNSPDVLEFVLKNEGIFSKGDFFKSRSFDLFGNGIINVDGPLWKVQRKAGLHFLNTRNLSVLTDVVLPSYLSQIINNFESSSGHVVDLASTFHELTTQLMGRMAYDMDMHHSDPFSQAFEYASGATGERFQNPLWRLTEAIQGSKLRKSLSEVKTFGSKIVSHAVCNRSAMIKHDTSLGTTSIAGSLINSLLDSIDDHQTVADAALNYLSAGRDTTAEALTWTFYLLMRHEEVLNKLQDEIVGNEKTDPTGLPYTLAVFFESLRLFPPVPFEIKTCEADVTLPDGTFLPHRSIVFWSVWSMNRSELIWGNDSALFRPDRWLVDGKLVNRSAFEFPVFNGGSRTCLGRKMAEAVAVMVISQLCRAFTFRSLDTRERISKNSLTLPMLGGLPCTVTRIGDMIAGGVQHPTTE